jgi:hypothetical protein
MKRTLWEALIYDAPKPIIDGQSQLRGDIF